MSNEFQINIGLRQGTVVSPYCFSMKLISRKISTTDYPKKTMYAGDIGFVAEHREELQDALDEWKELFTKHGRKMNIDNAEVMSIGSREMS